MIDLMLHIGERSLLVLGLVLAGVHENRLLYQSSHYLAERCEHLDN